MRTERDGDAVVLSPSGELDLATCPTFERHLLDALESTATRVTVDLRALSFIDSAGLRTLLRAHEHCNGDGRLQFLRGSGETERIFALTGFDVVLPFAD